MVTPDGKHSAPDRYLTDADRQAGNWDCIANIAGDLTRLVSALRAVLDLHRRVDAGKPWCVHCGKASASFVDYPCETVRTITDALGDA